MDRFGGFKAIIPSKCVRGWYLENPQKWYVDNPQPVRPLIYLGGLPKQCNSGSNLKKTGMLDSFYGQSLGTISMAATFYRIRFGIRTCGEFWSDFWVFQLGPFFSLKTSIFPNWIPTGILAKVMASKNRNRIAPGARRGLTQSPWSNAKKAGEYSYILENEHGIQKWRFLLKMIFFKFHVIFFFGCR